MDKRFIAHTDYIDNNANVSCILLSAVLSQCLPKRLDSSEKVEYVPSAGDFDYSDPNLIPLGDLNWARNWLSHVPDAADPALTPIEIPNAMLPFVGREYFWLLGKDIGSEHRDGSNWFLKDVDTLKKWNSLLYECDLSEFIEDDTLYSISEKVNFLSEWRVFVYEDAEQGAYNYLGDPMMFPDSDTVHEMIAAWRDDALDPRPRAYTLDVGIMSDGNVRRTVPLEVHPFVACGLYGFSAPIIADMLIAGYEWYRDEAGKQII